MQTITHLAMGVLIETVAEKMRDSAAKKPIIAVTALASHAVLDNLADMTYHPPQPLKQDRFWVWFHRLMYGAAGAAAILNRRYWFGILFAELPDLEWLVRMAAKPLKIDFSGGSYLHKYVVDQWFGSWMRKFTGRLPNWRMKNKAALVEIGLLAVLWGMIFSIGSKRK